MRDKYPFKKVIMRLSVPIPLSLDVLVSLAASKPSHFPSDKGSWTEPWAVLNQNPSRINRMPVTFFWFGCCLNLLCSDTKCERNSFVWTYDVQPVLMF